MARDEGNRKFENSRKSLELERSLENRLPAVLYIFTRVLAATLILRGLSVASLDPSRKGNFVAKWTLAAEPANIVGRFRNFMRSAVFFLFLFFLCNLNPRRRKEIFSRRIYTYV